MACTAAPSALVANEHVRSSSRKGSVDDDDDVSTSCSDAYDTPESTHVVDAEKNDDEPENGVFQERTTDPRPLVESLARILVQLAGMGNSPSQILTPFHSARVPGISLSDYFLRLAGKFQCSDASLVLSIVYIDRLSEMQQKVKVSPQSIHRLLLTSVVIAAKFHDDHYYSNAYYARVGGVTLHELNRLEECFLALVRFKLYVSPSEFEMYRGMLGL